MCELLGKTDRWIIYGEDGGLSLPTKEEVELLAVFRQLTDEARNNLLGLIQSLPHKS